MTFADKILHFHRKLRSNWDLPEGVELLFPFHDEDTWKAMEAFFGKYFSDENGRILIFGINPGRFGAGITGTPFTDPKILSEVCGIETPFKKKYELSAIFVYEFIQAFGTVEAFYQQFYITSLCPLGFVKEGRNYNYYDSKALTKAVEPHIIQNIQQNIAFGGSSKIALCMGQGQNYKYFKKLNEKHGFFEQILPLPHPRWVMQYRRKYKEDFIAKFVETFHEAINMVQV